MDSFGRLSKRQWAFDFVQEACMTVQDEITKGGYVGIETRIHRILLEECTDPLSILFVGWSCSFIGVYQEPENRSSIWYVTSRDLMM